MCASSRGGEVRGYYHADNPTAAFGETEYGHDFAVTDDRFLVDAWLYHYYGESPVLDFNLSAEKAEAFRRYGPEENWELMRGWEAYVDSRKPSGESLKWPTVRGGSGEGSGPRP